MNKKILVIDDDVDIISVLDRRLRQAGYDVEVAVNSKTGLQKVTDVLPDLILLDIMMPGIDGTKLCWILKSGKTHNTIPVIILSAKSANEIRTAAESVGADAYFQKPFDHVILLAKIKELIESSKISK
ncbi:MAG: response regulator transcription factor [Candidatus Omnitrophica bacterium]|nr:response regulator transcription factor [Candidatus Omnitrophota bacterium]